MEENKFYTVFISDKEDEDRMMGIDLDVPEQHLKLVLDLALAKGHHIEIISVGDKSV